MINDQSVATVTHCAIRVQKQGLVMSKGNATATWHGDLESLAEPFWLPFRDALRSDLPLAMASAGCSNLGFSQRIESMDRRQVSAFAKALGPVRYLTIQEGLVARVLGSAPERCGETLPTWRIQMGSFTVHYLTLARNALLDRYHLAMEHFYLQNDGFADLLRGTSLGNLVAREEAFSIQNVLSLHVTVSMEVLADRVLNGACDEELRVCRMGHAASTYDVPRQFGQFGVAA